MQTPDFGVASEPVSVLGGTAASHVSQIPISGCVEPDISDDFDIQKIMSCNQNCQLRLQMR